MACWAVGWYSSYSRLLVIVHVAGTWKSPSWPAGIAYLLVAMPVTQPPHWAAGLVAVCFTSLEEVPVYYWLSWSTCRCLGIYSLCPSRLLLYCQAVYAVSVTKVSALWQKKCRCFTVIALMSQALVFQLKQITGSALLCHYLSNHYFHSWLLTFTLILFSRCSFVIFFLLSMTPLPFHSRLKTLFSLLVAVRLLRWKVSVMQLNK